MEFKFHKCQGEFLLLPCLSCSHYVYVDKLDSDPILTKEITLGWLFWFIRLNFNTAFSKLRSDENISLFPSISILPEINFVWFKQQSSYITLKWLNFNKCIILKKYKKYGKN